MAPPNKVDLSFSVTCLLNCIFVSQSASMHSVVMDIVMMELRSVTEKTLDIKPATHICLGKIQYKICNINNAISTILDLLKRCI